MDSCLDAWSPTKLGISEPFKTETGGFKTTTPLDPRGPRKGLVQEGGRKLSPPHPMQQNHVVL